MLSAIDVANFFIYLNKKEFELSLTNKSLNHLVYLAYGWFYAKNDLVLFDDPIIVVKDHIEISNVFEAFKKYDNNIIDDYYNQFDISKFVSKEVELLIAIYDYYAQFSSNYLHRIIFHKNSPVTLTDKDNIINPKNIYDFFKSRQYFDDIH